MKKRKHLKSKILMLILVLAVAHTFVHLTFLNKNSTIDNDSVSGLSISGESIGENLEGKDVLKSFSRIFVVLEWFVAAFFVLFLHFSNKTGSNDEYDKIKGLVGGRNNLMETDLDKLYEVLKIVKTIRLSTIVKVFNVNKEVAMDWCKTLEIGNFASIEYPRFGEPQLVLEEKFEEVKNEESKKESS